MENETSVFFLTQSISKERCFRVFFYFCSFFINYYFRKYVYTFNPKEYL